MNNFEQQAYEAVANGTANTAQLRAVELDKLAKKAGFTTYKGSSDGQTLFSWGTELCDSGKDTFRSKAQLHEAQPFVSDLVPAFKGLIQAEKRVDTNRSMSNLLLDSQGRLLSREQLAKGHASAGLPMSRWALGQILNRAKAPAGALGVLRPEASDVQGLPPAIGSAVFASYMDGAKTAKGREKQVRIRSRLNASGNREVFAAQSPRSPIFDAHQVFEAFAAKAHPTAKGAVQYDGKRWKFSAGVMSHIEPTVGEIFEGNVWAAGCDDGSSAILIGADVVRARCVNLTTLVATDVESIRHQGKQLSFEEKIQNALVKAQSMLSGFADVWSSASTEAIADNAQEHGAEEIFRALVAKRLVWVNGVDADTLVNRLFTAWTKEPGYNKSDILNAVTRVAHENEWSSPWVTESLAQQAGELLYQPVYVYNTDYVSID